MHIKPASLQEVAIPRVMSSPPGHSPGDSKSTRVITPLAGAITPVSRSGRAADNIASGGDRAKERRSSPSPGSHS